MWYTATDVMTLLSVKQAKAYQVIKTLADEIANTKIPGKDRCYATTLDMVVYLLMFSANCKAAFDFLK